MNKETYNELVKPKTNNRQEIGGVSHTNLPMDRSGIRLLTSMGFNSPLSTKRLQLGHEIIWIQ